MSVLGDNYWCMLSTVHVGTLGSVHVWAKHSDPRNGSESPRTAFHIYRPWLPWLVHPAHELAICPSVSSSWGLSEICSEANSQITSFPILMSFETLHYSSLLSSALLASFDVAWFKYLQQLRDMVYNSSISGWLFIRSLEGDSQL